MLDVLAEIARQDRFRDRGHQTAVTAAARVIEAIDREQSPEQMVLEILGSPQAALEWCERMVPKLRALVASRTLKGPGDER